MHCRQSLKHDTGHPFDFFFFEFPLGPGVQYDVEVVGKIFKDHDLLIGDHVD